MTHVAEPRDLDLHKGFPEAAQPGVQELAASAGPPIPTPVALWTSQDLKSMDVDAPKSGNNGKEMMI